MSALRVAGAGPVSMMVGSFRDGRGGMRPRGVRPFSLPAFSVPIARAKHHRRCRRISGVWTWLILDPVVL